MEHLGDVGHVESCFVPFGDDISVGARKVHGLCQTYHRLQYHFRRTQWYSLAMRLKWNPFGDSANLDAS
jgi:hypothetical protein